MVLLNLVEKRLVCSSKWTTTWRHRIRDTSSNTHLQSFDSPTAVEGERPSFQTPDTLVIVLKFQDNYPKTG